MLEDVDFGALKEELFKELGRAVTDFDVLAYALYPKVFLDYNKTIELFGDVSNLDTATFLYGMRLGKKSKLKLKRVKRLSLN